jgi:hypothetical protein
MIAPLVEPKHMIKMRHVSRYQIKGQNIQWPKEKQLKDKQGPATYC